MHITFDSVTIGQTEARALVAFLTTLHPAAGSTPPVNSLDAPSAPGVANSPSISTLSPYLVEDPSPSSLPTANFVPPVDMPSEPSTGIAAVTAQDTEDQSMQYDPATYTEDAPVIPVAPTSTRKRRTKAEIAADAAAEAQAPPANPSNASPAPAAEASDTTQSATAPQVTVGADELRSLLNGYIAKHSMEAAIEKLRSFQCDRVTEALSLPADQLSLLAAALRG